MSVGDDEENGLGPSCCKTLRPFIRGKIRRVYTRVSYLIRHVLAKPRLILDEMCRLYGKFASYLRRVLCKTRLIFPRINGPTVYITVFFSTHNSLQDVRASE